MIITCAIIDDEPLAAALLESYAKKVPFLKLQGSFNSAVAAMRQLRDNPVDLIFLDIQMPELSGLEFARILPARTKVIFTTAFSQYAIDGYKVNAIGYMLKPIAFEEFKEVCNKALKLFTSDEQSADAANAGTRIGKDRFLFLKSEYKLMRINLDDITYIEGVKDYVKVYLDNGKKPVMSLMSMKKLEEHLPTPEFMRTHRSFIVHMSKVCVVDHQRITFDNVLIPISDSYKDDVQAFLDSHTVL